MARITLIKSDNAVYVDGVAKQINLSSLPENFHALQFDDQRGIGTLETLNPLANTVIEQSEFDTTYKQFVDQWNAQ